MKGYKITQEQAKLIYNCYAEINKAENFLKILVERKKQDVKEDELTNYLTNRDNPSGYYTLGHTIGSGSASIASVSPALTRKIVKSHLIALRRKLSDLINETIKAEGQNETRTFHR